MKTIGEGSSKKSELLDNRDKKTAFHSTQISILTDSCERDTTHETTERREKQKQQIWENEDIGKR